MHDKYGVNVNDAIKDMRKLGGNVAKLIPTFIARLSFKGERIMKSRAPVRTGTLKRSIHASPTTKPNMISTSVNYAFIANIKSRRRGYIEMTVALIEDLIPEEADRMIKQAMRKV